MRESLGRRVQSNPKTTLQRIIEHTSAWQECLPNTDSQPTVAQFETLETIGKASKLFQWSLRVDMNLSKLEDGPEMYSDKVREALTAIENHSLEAIHEFIQDGTSDQVLLLAVRLRELKEIAERRLSHLTDRDASLVAPPLARSDCTAEVCSRVMVDKTPRPITPEYQTSDRKREHSSPLSVRRPPKRVYTRDLQGDE